MSASRQIAILVDSILTVTSPHFGDMSAYSIYSFTRAVTSLEGS